jgi:hypothetical protein
MADDKNDRFIRWQKVAIDQLGYSLNLIFTLTIAGLGYFFSLLRDKDFVPGCSAKCALLLSFVALAFAASSGIFCTLNRLRDFRGTAQRAHESADAPSQDELRSVGRITWGLFYAELLAFTLGITALAIALLLTYGGKLA